MSERGAAPFARLEPQVQLPPDFAARAALLGARLYARALREGRGIARAAGGGEEFAGFRPYRPGEDVRALDWDLYARLDKPFVRVRRREASDRWLVLVDVSASMAVGPPGKISLAAQVAAGLAAVAVRSGIEIELRTVGDAERARRVVCSRRGDFARALAFVAGLRAVGAAPGTKLPVDGGRAAGRLFLVGDLLDDRVEDVLALTRRGREVVAVRLLAPSELAPALGPARWWDPERERAVDVFVDEAARSRYERALEDELANWTRRLALHRARHVCHASDAPFEDVVRAALGT